MDRNKNPQRNQILKSTYLCEHADWRRRVTSCVSRTRLRALAAHKIRRMMYLRLIVPGTSTWEIPQWCSPDHALTFRG
jgi:hypothetical protein